MRARRGEGGRRGAPAARGAVARRRRSVRHRPARSRAEVHAGEIVGMRAFPATASGSCSTRSGRSAAFGEVSGADHGLRGGRTSPGRRRRAGLLRPKSALARRGASMSLADNAILTAAKNRRLVRRSLIDFNARGLRGRVHREVQRHAAARRHRRARSPGQSQKFIVGREIMQDPKVLVVAQPTWASTSGPRLSSGNRSSISATAAARCSSSRRSWTSSSRF